MGKPHAKLKRARKSRGWSLYKATREIRGISNQQLKNLEDGKTSPTHVRAATMVRILAVYDELQIDDFIGYETGLALA